MNASSLRISKKNNESNDFIMNWEGNNVKCLYAFIGRYKLSIKEVIIPTVTNDVSSAKYS